MQLIYKKLRLFLNYRYKDAKSHLSVNGMGDEAAAISAAIASVESSSKSLNQSNAGATFLQPQEVLLLLAKYNKDQIFGTGFETAFL